MEQRKSGDYRTLKYYEQLNSYKYAEVNNMIVPMFRMSEVYYIAAEAIYKKDLDKAKDYLKLVKKAEELKMIRQCDRSRFYGCSCE